MPLPRLNPLYYLAIGSLVVFVGLGLALWASGRRGTAAEGDLVVYCAAAARKPLEEAAAKYEAEYGLKIRPQYGGSGTLLNQIDIAKSGDLFLAGDASHVETARRKGLAAESLPIAWLEPVLVKLKANPKGIELNNLDDLLRPGVRVALGEPDSAEIGRLTRKLLIDAGRWEMLEQHVTQRGVFKPTEPDLAIALLAGGVDAAILWRSTAAQHDKFEIVPVPELRKGRSLLSIAVLNRAEDATAALRFARFLTAEDRGLDVFRQQGFEVLPGDQWADRPKLTVFAGSVNRRALEPILDRFRKREGVEINTVFNACGFLVGQMKTVKDSGGFPDVYIACDVKYLEPVNEQFQDAVNVSNTPIVICVKKGGPKANEIKTLPDLLKPGVRVALGERKMVTIGVLCQRLLEAEGLWQKLLDSGNLVNEATSSAHLVPAVVHGDVDAVLCYQTDTVPERERLEIIAIDSPLARAVQPFSIAKTSQHKYLCRRLLEEIARARGEYEALGFGWEMK